MTKPSTEECQSTRYHYWYAVGIENDSGEASVRARQLRFGGAHTLTQWLTGNDRARQRRSISKVCARSERLLVSVSHSQSCDKYREMEEFIRNHGTRQQMNGVHRPRVQREVCTHGVSNDYAEGLQSLHVANTYKHVA